MDEMCSLFKFDYIIDLGISVDGWFVGVYVFGVYLDVGGGYYCDGLLMCVGNMVIDYFNCFSDKLFL